MTAERSKRFPLALADLVKPDGVDSKGRTLRPGGTRAAPARLASERAPRPASPARPSAAVTVKPAHGKPHIKAVPLVPAALRPAKPGKLAFGHLAATVKPVAKLTLKPTIKPAFKVPGRPAASPVNAFHAAATKPVQTVGLKPSVAAQTFTVKPLSRHQRGTQRAPELVQQTHDVLNSDRVRERMVERLRAGGIRDVRVLAALAAIARHQFVDAGLATQAYEDAALPIGHHQTISKPSVVARMIELAAAGRALSKVLEIGTGCGYQAAVLSRVAREVYSIERIKPLFERAKSNLRSLRLPNLRLHYGDGRLGLPAAAPFDAILLAAAGLEVPQALLEQLEIGGRLIAPVGGEEQVLTLIERISPSEWRGSRLDRVFFVPLKNGVV
jgi:protein-L-isoaspartate(D-aspartate) O-methyltransferase